MAGLMSAVKTNKMAFVYAAVHNSVEKPAEFSPVKILSISRHFSHNSANFTAFRSFRNIGIACCHPYRS